MCDYPSILKLFRYTKASDNAGYGMDKIYSWERLTGEKVDIETSVMCTDVTFWRPKIGTSIKKMEENEGISTAPNSGKKMQDKVFRIIKSSPNISKAEIGRLCPSGV